MQGILSVERMCRVAAVSRVSFYRWLEPAAPAEEEMEVRAAIQAVVLEHRRRYGYRRVTRELRRRGMIVNHKRVARLMGEDNLLAVQPRAWVATTNSGHELEVYMNLAVRMKVTGINQLWVADLTYIRLAAEFVYLAVVLDAYSRKAVGWALGRTLAASLAVTALEQAIAQRQPPPGLVHHSDRGLQYASEEYARVLRLHAITPSMSRPANPYDNAFCESFMRTLKREEIDARTYPRPGRSARPCRGVHRAVLQSLPSALSAGLPAARGVRTGGCNQPRRRLRRGQHEFFQAWGNLSMG